MKKTLIASAVAAAALTTNAFAMDPASDLAERLDSMPTFYGNIQLAYVNTETDPAGGTKSTTNDTADNGSTLGVKHEHAISEELTGFLKAEFEFTSEKGSNNGLTKVDESYIGVKTDTHMVLVGSDDTIAEWADPVDMYEAVGLGADFDMKESDQVQYVGSFDALTVGVSYSLDNDTDVRAALGAMYEMGDLAFEANYTMGRDDQSDATAGERGDSYGISVSYAMGDLSLSAQYNAQGEETSAAGVGQDDDQAFIGLLGSYSMGANSFTLGYALKTTDGAAPAGEEEVSSIYGQALHNVSDNMYVYTEILASTSENDDKTVDQDDTSFAIGAAYSF